MPSEAKKEARAIEQAEREKVRAVEQAEKAKAAIRERSARMVARLVGLHVFDESSVGC